MYIWSLFYVLDSVMSCCLDPRLPTAEGEVASEREAGVWIVQSDHGATWRRDLLSGPGWSEAVWLRGLCVQGQQQAGGSDVLCQTDSADVTVELEISFGKETLLKNGTIWDSDSYSLPHRRLLAHRFKAQRVFGSAKGIITFGRGFVLI